MTARAASKIELPASVEEFVQRLFLNARPDTVVLFGSFLRSDHRNHSDIDLLVVMADQAAADEVIRRRSQLTAGVYPRVDLVVSSWEEMREARGERAAFLRSVLEHGQSLSLAPGADSSSGPSIRS